MALEIFQQQQISVNIYCVPFWRVSKEEVVSFIERCAQLLGSSNLISPFKKRKKKEKEKKKKKKEKKKKNRGAPH